MSGIVVGIDSSNHSMTALEWAMREAAVHGAPLTVVTVEVVVASGWGGSHPMDRPVVVVTHSVPDGWPRDDAPRS